jgi:serine/threonine protein kinase
MDLGHQHAASTDDIHDAQSYLVVANPGSKAHGTEIYMAPERIMMKEYSFPSDIWGFGLPMLTKSTREFPVNNLYDSPDLTRTSQAVKLNAFNNKTASGPWLGMKRASGFATAPIWYQQSMATGPPQ